MPTVRTCTKCGRELPATAEFFHPATTLCKKTGKRYQGLRGDCRDCFNAKSTMRYQSSDEVKQANRKSVKRRRGRPDVQEAERIYQREKKRRDRVTDPEGEREKLRAWRAANPEKYAEHKKYKGMSPQIAKKIAAREARLREATPSWVNKQAIAAFYKTVAILTRKTGVLYSVDHIMPLKGTNSCGLHVPWNLQVIPLGDNIAKGNKFCAGH